MSEPPKWFYFSVKDIKFQDLFDWSDPIQRCKVTETRIRKLRRQSSQSGTMTEANETKVALFRYGEEVFAVNEKCPHLGGPLHIGDIEELGDKSITVRCPWHGWKIDLRTGQVRQPAGRNVATTVYNTKVDSEGNIEIGFQEFASKFFNCEDF